MSGRNKEFTQKVKDEAMQIISSSGVNLLEDNVPILDYAKQLMTATGCNIDTAKVKIAWAARQLRYIAVHGELAEEQTTEWGGKRRNATGRPRKQE